MRSKRYWLKLASLQMRLMSVRFGKLSALAATRPEQSIAATARYQWLPYGDISDSAFASHSSVMAMVFCTFTNWSTAFGSGFMMVPITANGAFPLGYRVLA